MTTRREVTQFSRIEYEQQIDAIRAKQPDMLSTKEQAVLFFDNLVELKMYQRELDQIGGYRNIQRVRVFGAPGAFAFEYVLVKPLAQVEAERREAAMKARMEAEQKAREEARLAQQAAEAQAKLMAEAKAKARARAADKEQRRRFLLNQRTPAAYDAAVKQRREGEGSSPAKKAKRLPSRQVV